MISLKKMLAWSDKEMGYVSTLMQHVLRAGKYL